MYCSATVENISFSCPPSEICATSCLSKRTRSCIHKNEKPRKPRLHIHICYCPPTQLLKVS
ncbi:F-box protein [Paenibacillus sp. GCM10012304]|uniref:F-box protein n=1 Tax=Paenibacillus sp. GCM10012304 TaxID=3317341 RepID=UPI003608B735